MAHGHGGRRPGAGRPRSSPHSLRRELVAWIEALQRGLAGDVYGEMSEEEREERAIQAVAQAVARVMVDDPQKGLELYGGSLLKLSSMRAEAQAQEVGSALLRALDREAQGPQRSLPLIEDAQAADDAGDGAERAMDYQSIAQRHDPPWDTAEPGAVDAGVALDERVALDAREDSERSAGTRAPAPGHRHPPTPPGATPHPFYVVHPQILESDGQAHPCSDWPMDGSQPALPLRCAR